MRRGKEQLALSETEAAVVKSFRNRLAVFEMNGLQFGRNGADKNLTFDAKKESIVVVGKENGRALKFPVWLELVSFIHALQFEIELNCVVASGAHANVFPAGNSNGGDIGGIRGINCNAINRMVA